MSTKPSRPRLKVADTTPEKMGLLMASHVKGLMFHRDELAGFLGAFDKYGGGGSDRAFWSECYNGGYYAIDRVKHPEPIRIYPFWRPTAAMSGCTAAATIVGSPVAAVRLPWRCGRWG